MTDAASYDTITKQYSDVWGGRGEGVWGLSLAVSHSLSRACMPTYRPNRLEVVMHGHCQLVGQLHGGLTVWLESFFYKTRFTNIPGWSDSTCKCSENVTGGIFEDLTWAIFVVVVAAAVVVVVFLCAFTLLWFLYPHYFSIKRQSLFWSGFFPGKPANKNLTSYFVCGQRHRRFRSPPLPPQAFILH